MSPFFVLKDVRNQVNRLVNCETANLDKIVDVAIAPSRKLPVEILITGNCSLLDSKFLAEHSWDTECIYCPTFT